MQYMFRNFEALTLWYSCRFSQSRALSSVRFVLLFKHTTGQTEQPNVQQQHKQPNKSHLKFKVTILLRIWLMRQTVALNSSGAIWKM